MFKINEIVQHQKTGKIGKVTGYGCQEDTGTHSLTIKVQIFKKKIYNQLIMEDVMSEWSSWRNVTQIPSQNSSNQRSPRSRLRRLRRHPQQERVLAQLNPIEVHI
ncbi:MAG: hypothetical protein ACFCU7_18370 [Pleurocapsa sp.]